MLSRISRKLLKPFKAVASWHHSTRARRFYRDYVRAHSLCFDVGANMGDRTKLFLDLGASVVAIEPQDACAEQLRTRFKGDARVTVVQKAAGPAPGEAEMLVGGWHTVSSLSKEWVGKVKESGRFGNMEWKSTIKVPVTTLDALIAEFGLPQFCKIDVEGFEPQVIKGLSHPIRHISFEFTPEALALTEAAVSHLASLGRAEFNYSLGESMELGMSGWVSASQIMDTLRGLPNQAVFGDVYVRTDT